MALKTRMRISPSNIVMPPGGGGPTTTKAAVNIPIPRIGIRACLLALCGRREHVLKKGLKLSEMVARGGVDDHRPILAVAVDLPHPESVPFEPPPDLGSPEGDVEPEASDLFHGVAHFGWK
jgi:hypothetical protein